MPTTTSLASEQSVHMTPTNNLRTDLTNQKKYPIKSITWYVFILLLALMIVWLIYRQPWQADQPKPSISQQQAVTKYATNPPPNQTNALLVGASSATPTWIDQQKNASAGDVTNLNEQIHTSIVATSTRQVLQQTFASAKDFRTALIGAAILQNYLAYPERQSAPEVLKRYDCQVISLNEEDQNLIKALIFDTPEKMQTLSHGLKDYRPSVSKQIAFDAQGNPISSCASITRTHVVVD